MLTSGSFRIGRSCRDRLGYVWQLYNRGTMTKDLWMLPGLAGNHRCHDRASKDVFKVRGQNKQKRTVCLNERKNFKKRDKWKRK